MFHCHCTILLRLLGSASRTGETLSLKVDLYRAKERQVVIRKSKGRKPRTLPVRPKWVEALNVWLRQRSKITLHSLRRYLLSHFQQLPL